MIFIFFYAIFSVTNGQEWVNDYDGYLYFECPEGQSISRLMSIHDNGHEDRRWNYKCCVAANTCYHDCHYSPYINAYDEAMDYTVQDGYVVTGLESEHSNGNEDRRW